jgi:hypothetical protein
MKAQNTAILTYLEKGHKLTPMNALAKFKCFRLSARINDLRNMGHHIVTTTVKKNGKRFAQYQLH